MSSAATVAAALPAEAEGALARARSGAMPLTELLNQAAVLSGQGLAEASAALYEQWLAHTESPHRHVVCFNWGTVLGALHRPAEAEAAYRQALALQPGFPPALLNLGHQLERLGRTEEALTAWQQVLDAGASADLPLRLHAHNNRARLLEVQRRFDEAEAQMAASLELKPDQPDVLQHYVHIRQKQCKWPLYQPPAGVSAHQMLAGTSALAMLGASDDPALQLLAAQRFVLTKVAKPAEVPLHTQTVPRSGRVRVGYLSGDLCMHAVGLLTPELLELHDRQRLEVFAFCWSREDGSAQRARLVKALDHCVPIGHLDDTAAATLIARCGIDVLVDLQGLTSGARPGILVQRPAPVQVGYLGLPATSALPGVDWMIADRYVVRPDYEPYCSERPLFVENHCYQASDRRRDVGRVPTRAECGLPEDQVVFCSFNNNHKFTEEVFACWMRVLAQVPRSVLWLLADNPWSQANMLAAADAHGVARERLVFAPRVAPADYLARMAVADLFLDTFPYNAGTTASDALWMGTPLLTRSGRSYISRMAGSLLTHVGLPDLITESLVEYERLAVALGRQPARLASYKRYLAEHGRSSALFDMPGLVAELDGAFERLALQARAVHPRR